MKHNEKGASNYTKQHDKKIKTSTLAARDRVLVRNLSERGEPGKIRPYWEDKIHSVIRQTGEDSPVIKPEKGDGRTRVLNRTLVLPCDYLEMEEIHPASTGHHSNTNREGQRKANRKQAKPSQNYSGFDSEEVRQFHPRDLEQFEEELDCLMQMNRFQSQRDKNKSSTYARILMLVLEMKSVFLW